MIFDIEKKIKIKIMIYCDIRKSINIRFNVLEHYNLQFITKGS